MHKQQFIPQGAIKSSSIDKPLHLKHIFPWTIGKGNGVDVIHFLYWYEIIFIHYQDGQTNHQRNQKPFDHQILFSS